MNGPAGRWGHSAVYDSDGDRMFVYGGIDDNGHVLDDLWEYRFQDGAWRRLSATEGPGPRFGHSMSAGEQRTTTPFHGFAIFGGSDGCVVHEDVWVFVPTGASGAFQWRQVQMDSGTAGPGPRVWPASVAWAYQFVTVGGLTSGYEPAQTDIVWTIDLSRALASGTGRWYARYMVGGPPQPRFGATLTRVDQTAVPFWLFALVGGYVWSGDEYAPRADSWAYLWPPDPPPPPGFTPPWPSPTPVRTPIPTWQVPVPCPQLTSPVSSSTATAPETSSPGSGGTTTATPTTSATLVPLVHRALLPMTGK